MNQNDEAKLMTQAVIGGIASAAKVIIDRGIIKIKPFVQPPEATVEAPHYFTGDYVAESIMMAGKAFIDVVDAMDPTNPANQQEQ